MWLIPAGSGCTRENGPAGLWPCCPWQEVALSSIWADFLQGHVLSTGNCSKLFQGQRRSAVSVKSPWHTYCFLGFWSLTLTGFQACCHLLFAVGCSQQLYHFNCLQLPPRQSTRYLLFKSIIEGSLEVKLPTIWTDEKQSREEAKRRERLEERRVEEKE